MPSNTNNSNKKTRVRFAPSPTGELHIGSVRTALFDFLLARHNNGKNILRIEDTDAKRYVPGSVERMVENLNWLGIEFDEHPILEKISNVKFPISNKIQNPKSKIKNNITENENCEMKIENSCGKYGPYIQSERLGIYQEYAMKLVEDGNAYYCFCSEERLKKMREDQEKKKIAPMYDRKCVGLTKEEIEKNLKAKKPYVIRMKVPYSGVTEFEDLIRGSISIDNSNIDDQILVKSDGMPTYHLANVVDDHLMEITHVIRGEEWLPSTPKHILLYQAFNWAQPKYAHLPLVLAPDKSKLSKRHGTVSIEEFRKSGYLPEALINYIALLGWNPKTEKEFFTLHELIKEFDISKVNKSGAVFDIEKLNYFNQQYIKSKTNEELFSIISNFQFPISNKFSKFNFKKLKKIIAVIKERMIKLTDFEVLSKMFFEEIKYEASQLIFKKSTKSSTLKGLQLTAHSLQLTASQDWESVDKINGVLLEVVNKNDLTNGDVFWPIRFALSGVDKSPSPPELLWALGKTDSLERINNAINKLSK
jgi:glutamyl-tRNA synthetase